MMPKMQKIECIKTDLWNDGNGWSTNCSWANTEIIEVPENLSDLAKIRRIKAALGIQGMRKDSWDGSEWCWREGGIGAYATIIG
jgi:hypothetical protein